MSTLHIEHLEPLCQLNPLECRRPSNLPLHSDRAADSGAPTESPRPLDLSPVSAYEIVTRQMIEATQRDVAEIKGRINNLMVMVCGAVLVNIILRMAGLG